MVCAPSLPTSVHIPRVDTGGAAEGALGAGRLAFVRRRIPPHHQGVPCVVLLLSSFIKSYKVSYDYVPSLITYRYTAIPLYRYLLPVTAYLRHVTCYLPLLSPSGVWLLLPSGERPLGAMRVSAIERDPLPHHNTQSTTNSAFHRLHY
jgi:hypothetical protein